MFTRAFDQRVRLLLGVLAFSLVFGIAFAAYALWPANTERGYQPEQPMYFPHSVMAGKHDIDCLYCHSQAEKSAQAGIPPVSTCMKCHTKIQTRDAEGNIKEGIAALLRHWPEPYEDTNGNGAYDAGEPYEDLDGDRAYDADVEPIRWVKVHDLADFVFFDHSRHLTEQAGLECADCHGPVEEMDRMYRANSLKMGWCLDCHKQPPPEGAPAWQETRAPINCTTCHR
ncbi:MAG: cytochrome c3 family protein [Planctomycetota bacterium]|jgi:hypothetical protein